MLKILSIISLVMCGAITLKPNAQFSFYETFSVGERIKFECSEHENREFELIIHQGNIKEPLTDLTVSYTIVHTEASKNDKFYFVLKNTSSETLKIWFLIPDVTKEITGPLGPVDEQDVVTELKNTLEHINFAQKNHIAKQSVHEKNVKSAKGTMFFFFVFEVVFNVFIALYFYNDIVNLFTNKRRKV
ncbi:endoplasmic reticulum membrane protein [Tubulinosema ratisbonensis]|uniref:Endoplasmic reticulum membrane protein n=1 Tax=Tubulinosema ratisbonensis TaxID=291195 RepID=A0A437AK85_9MICR|nr:endoplasmic reticulum membrane protein [Tubulinosema ratisbonensis]